MAFCMNCGAQCKEGAAFCMNCGKPLPVMGPVQPPRQTVQSQRIVSPQPQQPQPVQPMAQPYQQPVPPTIQPVQPTVQPQPVYQGQTAPAAKNTKPKSNGLCSAGFVFSLLGIFLFGITSLFGLLFSVFGLISAGKKKQDGKGKAVAGIVMSVVMLAAVLVVFVFLRNPLMDKYEELTGRTFPTRKVSVDFGEKFEGKDWVVLEDETCLRFNAKDGTFNNYIASQPTDDLYLTGHYKMYSGKKALRHINSDSVYADGREWIEGQIDDDVEYQKEKLIVLICDYEAFICNGESQSEFDTVTEHFYGFYTRINIGGRFFSAVEMNNLEANTSFTMILEEEYDEYLAIAESESSGGAE